MTVAERDKRGQVVGTRDAHVWHCSLALHPNQPELSDERWGEIRERSIEEMKFAREQALAQCRWGRSGTAARRAVCHTHLVVTRVAEDGSKASVHNDRPQAQKACRGLEQRFGLGGLRLAAPGAGR